MKAACDTCQHEKLSILQEPCTDCSSIGHPTQFTNWVPMTPFPSDKRAAQVANIGNADGSGFEMTKHVAQPEPIRGNPKDAANYRPEQRAMSRKDDTGKLDVTLFFDDLPHAIEAVTEVLQWAITKKLPEPYRRGSWQGVDNFQQRYRGALLRHIIGAAKESKVNGLPIEQTTDHETELLQLAHIATDAMFLLENAIRRIKGIA